MTKRARTLRADEPAAIAEAVQCLAAGGLVAFPTETVYGLGADATQERAVARVFAAKARPRFNPLIVHLAEVEAAAAEAVFDRRAQALAARFWPGPLTLVLPRRAESRVARLCSAGLESLALRLPAHAVARTLLKAVDRPVAAPSANPSGRLSPTSAAHVAAGLGARVDLILDGGPCRVGLESTVLGLTDEKPRLLRAGAVTREELEATLREPVAEAREGDPVTAPGQLASHYAPQRPLRLAARDVGPEEALLAFGPAPLAGAAETLNLSARGDLVEAAANLFAHLHTLDQPRFAAIAVMAVPERGLGVAINDRLRRAAAGDPD